MSLGLHQYLAGNAGQSMQGLWQYLKEAESEENRERLTLLEGERREALLRLSASDPLCDSDRPGLPSLALSPLTGLLLPAEGCPPLCPMGGLSSCAVGESRGPLREPCSLADGVASCNILWSVETFCASETRQVLQ